MNDLAKDIRDVTNLILDDYGRGRYIDRTDPFSQPDTDTIRNILDNLRRLIYPGFFKAQTYRYYTRENGTSTLVEDILYNLTRQVALTLSSRQGYVDKPETEISSEAERITLEFMRRIPSIRDYLDKDIEAILDGDPAAASKDMIIYAYPGLYAIMVYRIAHELLLLDVPMIPRMMSEIAHQVTGIDINPGATIGKYFFIDHGTGIVIGETTLIGDNVKIYQGVTLGALSTRKGQLLRGVKRHPTIEDRVTIYSGASILGGDTVIGEGAVIGANVFITESIPAGAKVSMRNRGFDVSV